MQIGSFKRTVTTAGTAVPISATKMLVKKVAIKALAANTGLVGIGQDGANDVAAANWFELSAKESCSLEPFELRGTDTTIDLNKVYLDSAVNGEGVCVIYGYDETTG
jgi:hypothetical protein